MATTRKSTTPKNPTTATTAVTVKKGTNIVSIQDALRAQAAEVGNRTAPPTGNKIRVTQDKKFILPDGTTTAGPLELVIVEFATAHTFYDRPFNKDTVMPPACFAVGADPRKMFPAGNVPVKQASDCQSCPMNQFGSKGDGKACQNSRVMAVLPPEADADTPIWLLQTSPTAIKGFDSYVNGVARSFQSMPVSVITTVSFDEDVTYSKLVFSDPRPNDNVAVHFARQEEAREMLYAERDVSGYEPLAPSRKAVRR